MTLRMPHLDYRPGEMTDADKVIYVDVVPAHFDDVLPLVAASYRALQLGPVALLRDERRSPGQMLLARREELASRPGHWFRTPSGYGVTVSSPRGAEHLTVIEQPLGGVIEPSLCEPVSAMAPGWEVASFETLYDAKARQSHGLTIWKGGRKLRRAYAHCGFNRVGWDFIDQGTPRLWEDRVRYGARSVRQRIDRPLVLRYLEINGIDLESLFVRRDFAASAHLRCIDIYDPETADEPLREFETAYDHVLACGFGERRTWDSGEEIRAAAARLEAAQAICDEARRVIRRAPPDAMARLMDEYSAKLDALGDPLELKNALLGDATRHLLAAGNRKREPQTKGD